MEEVMIGGELITKNEKGEIMDTHAPDEFIERENELTESDIENIMGGNVTKMQESKMASFEDFSSMLSNFKPKEVKEDKPMIWRGYFKATIESIKRYTGVSEKTGNPYDMYSFTVNAYAPGNKKATGYIGEFGKKFSETFSLIDGQYNDSRADFEKLLNFLFYAGIEIKFSNWDEFDAQCEALEGKECFIKVKPKYQWKVEGEGSNKTFNKVLGDDGKQLLKLDKDGYVVHTWDIVPTIPNMIKDDEVSKTEAIF